ncbi:MAG: hypothetical protein M1823_000816 [Watsoniomyces obsoletus]|nr:MAG: hypothetical protein M1823_000816 [Watsoniomyces obsoletus]
MSTQASRGAEALERKDFSSAIQHYTSALTDFPTSPDFYIKRSIAQQRSSPPNYDLALQDAERAVHYAHRRGKREVIATAQMRRGIALFGLKRWADAAQCFEWSKMKNQNENGLQIWLKKADVELEKAKKAGEEEDVTVVEIPEAMSDSSLQEQSTKKNTAAGVMSDGKMQDTLPLQEVKKPEGVQTPVDKIRHEWYQTSEMVVVTLFVKGVPKDKATIDIHDRSVSISFPMPNSSTYDFSLDPLFAPINQTESTSSIMSTKIEMKLKKSTPGYKWHALETKEPVNDTTTTSDDVVHRASLQTSSSPTTIFVAPAYPTSSRTGPKNWDKLAAELSKKKKPPKTQPMDSSTDKPQAAQEDGNQKKDEKEEEDNDDDDDDGDGDGGDPVNGFFKKLYANADPDTRRAMMKSYQESNGTALSTNWADVGKGIVETNPPDGMVAKKWND